MYYVEYDVEGFGHNVAGPYRTYEEAQYQRYDIAGYDKVSGAVIMEKDIK